MKYHNKPKPVELEMIALWEYFFKVSMPNDLKAILLESDGPVLYDKTTGKELQFLSAKDAIKYYESYNFSEYCADAIPVSLDGCGNFVVYKIKNGTIVGVFAMSAGNMGWQDSKRLKNTIKEVVQMEQCIEEVLFS